MSDMAGGGAQRERVVLKRPEGQSQGEQTQEKEPWYWPNITREEAERKLAGLPDGSFLVRDNKVAGDFTLIVRSNSTARHVRIYHQDGHYGLAASDFPFSSLSDLIHFYKVNSLASFNKRLDIFLRGAVCGSSMSEVSQFAAFKELYDLSQEQLKAQTRLSILQQQHEELQKNVAMYRLMLPALEVVKQMYYDQMVLQAHVETGLVDDTEVDKRDTIRQVPGTLQGVTDFSDGGENDDVEKMETENLCERSLSQEEEKSLAVNTRLLANRHSALKTKLHSVRSHLDLSCTKDQDLTAELKSVEDYLLEMERRRENLTRELGLTGMDREFLNKVLEPTMATSEFDRSMWLVDCDRDEAVTKLDGLPHGAFLLRHKDKRHFPYVLSIVVASTLGGPATVQHCYVVQPRHRGYGFNAALAVFQSIDQLVLRHRYVSLRHYFRDIDAPLAFPVGCQEMLNRRSGIEDPDTGVSMRTYSDAGVTDGDYANTAEGSMGSESENQDTLGMAGEADASNFTTDEQSVGTTGDISARESDVDRMSLRTHKSGRSEEEGEDPVYINVTDVFADEASKKNDLKFTDKASASANGVQAFDTDRQSDAGEDALYANIDFTIPRGEARGPDTRITDETVSGNESDYKNKTELHDAFIVDVPTATADPTSVETKNQNIWITNATSANGDSVTPHRATPSDKSMIKGPNSDSVIVIELGRKNLISMTELSVDTQKTDLKSDSETGKHHADISEENLDNAHSSNLSADGEDEDDQKVTHKPNKDICTLGVAQVRQKENGSQQFVRSVQADSDEFDVSVSDREAKHATVHTGDEFEGGKLGLDHCSAESSGRNALSEDHSASNTEENAAKVNVWNLVTFFEEINSGKTAKKENYTKTDLSALSAANDKSNLSTSFTEEDDVMINRGCKKAEHKDDSQHRDVKADAHLLSPHVTKSERKQNSGTPDDLTMGLCANTRTSGITETCERQRMVTESTTEVQSDFTISDLAKTDKLKSTSEELSEELPTEQKSADCKSEAFENALTGHSDGIEMQSVVDRIKLNNSERRADAVFVTEVTSETKTTDFKPSEPGHMLGQGVLGEPETLTSSNARPDKKIVDSPFPRAKSAEEERGEDGVQSEVDTSVSPTNLKTVGKEENLGKDVENESEINVQDTRMTETALHDDHKDMATGREVMPMAPVFSVFDEDDCDYVDV